MANDYKKATLFVLATRTIAMFNLNLLITLVAVNGVLGMINTTVPAHGIALYRLRSSS